MKNVVMGVTPVSVRLSDTPPCRPLHKYNRYTVNIHSLLCLVSLNFRLVLLNIGGGIACLASVNFLCSIGKQARRCGSDAVGRYAIGNARV